MISLGYDIGSSFIKASLFDASKGVCIASASVPDGEMKINSPQHGWAEQNPETWWNNVVLATKKVLADSGITPDDIKAIGISYQMHGLVVVDKNHNVLRPSIIWCDSRASEIGDKAFGELGKSKCLKSLLNSPGNFTASKLKWVKDNEPEIYANIHKIMLPGDYIAMKLTGEINTTVSGLSEGIMWDFEKQEQAGFLLEYYGIDNNIIPNTVPCFGIQGELTNSAASELGLKPGTKLCYRAGDQPNNAFSLNVLNPGEVAATAGTSGVIYGVSDNKNHDPLSRVNSFVHVNNSADEPKIGNLLCLNGTGILYSWLKNLIGCNDYNEMNDLSANISIGAEGLHILPFGNGAERILQNKNIGCQIRNLNFNVHNKAHIIRSAQEGIVFSLFYGIKILEDIGINIKTIKAGHSNMFLSPVFRNALSDLSQTCIELYKTDGAEGAARGAGIGIGFYPSFDSAFTSLEKIISVEPDIKNHSKYEETYNNWLNTLKTIL